MHPVVSTPMTQSIGAPQWLSHSCHYAKPMGAVVLKRILEPIENLICPTLGHTDPFQTHSHVIRAW